MKLYVYATSPAGAKADADRAAAPWRVAGEPRLTARGEFPAWSDIDPRAPGDVYEFETDRPDE